MEGRFGHDFSRVRVHADLNADRSAREIGARAYTSGTHIVFSAASYRPESVAGQHLLAHELTHVVQQSGKAAVIQRQAEGEARQDAGSSTIDTMLKVLETASPVVPGLQPVHQAVELVRAVTFFWEHREEHLRQLLDGVDAKIATIPTLARARLADVLSVAGTGRDAAACVGEQLLVILESLAVNWRETLSSFLRDIFFVGLFERSIPTIIAQSELLFEDVRHGEFRSAIDRSIAIMTEINAIAGVLYLWYALIATVVGAAAGSEVPVAGNAAGAAAGLTLAQVVNIGLISSVVATETARVGRGIDDMIRFWADLPARERGCRDVAEGVFALTLTAALFYIGPQIQRFARSIISRATAATRSTLTAAGRGAAASAEGLRPPQFATPGGLRFAGPEPVSPGSPRQRGPMPQPRVNPPSAPPRPTRIPEAPPTQAPPETPTARRPAEPSRAPSERPAAAGATPAAVMGPAAEEATRRADACRDTFGLLPGVHARWHRQRSPIGGHTTVESAAFRLDAGRAPPPGQGTDRRSREWARNIGRPRDDAGHVIARAFGGTRLYNVSPDGNIFPQDLSYNRGRMRVRDGQAAALHDAGCDVCVHVDFEYESAAALRPDIVVHSIMVRRPSEPDFIRLDPERIPNP
jgi:hypothetical protein